MSEKIRTFIAFPLPEPVKEAIREVQEGIAASLRLSWVKPDNIHLTLKFLGDIDPAALDPIAGIMSETAADFSFLTLSAKGIGVFPGMRNPRVLWVGLSGDIHPLMSLQAKLEEGLAALGFPKEARGFTAHLTIARIKERIDPRNLSQAMEKFSRFETDPFTSQELILYQSKLHPKGAVYTPLKRIRLKG
jgi:2'-5' RNA ligase